MLLQKEAKYFGLLGQILRMQKLTDFLIMEAGMLHGSLKLLGNNSIVGGVINVHVHIVKFNTSPVSKCC
jgi:hypothetical protein